MRYKFTGGVPSIIKDLKDVTIQGSEIAFGKSWTKSKIDEVLTHATTGEKSKESGLIKKKAISESDKTRISEMVGGDVLANIDSLGVYEFIASTDEKDTDNDKFEKSLLDQWAVQYTEGVPFVFRHDYDYGIGSTFKAEVVRNAENTRWELIVGVYVLPSAKLETDTAKNLIDGGVYKKCSIRARTGEPKVIEGENWYDTTYIYTADLQAKALELSLVPWGANESATRIKEEKNKQFQLIENKMIEKLKHLGNAETEITAELVKEMSEKLHSYQEKEAAQLQVKIDMFVNKSMLLDKTADKDDLETFAKALSPEKLDAKIVALIEKESFLKNQLTIENPTTVKRSKYE